MARHGQTSSQLLCAEILAQAQRESLQVVRRAQQQAESFLANAAAEADKLRQQELTRARAKAAHEAELILATVPVEAQRLRSGRIDALLESIRDEARKQLLAREGFEYRQALVVLAAEALRQMEGLGFTVKLSPSDYLRFGVGLAQDIVRRIDSPRKNLSIVEDPTVEGGGLIVQDPEGHHVVDNRLLARLERLWPELRRKIARQVDLIRTEPPVGGGHDS